MYTAQNTKLRTILRRIMPSYTCVLPVVLNQIMPLLRSAVANNSASCTSKTNQRQLAGLSQMDCMESRQCPPNAPSKNANGEERCSTVRCLDYYIIFVTISSSASISSRLSCWLIHLSTFFLLLSCISPARRSSSRMK